MTSPAWAGDTAQGADPVPLRLGLFVAGTASWEVKTLEQLDDQSASAGGAAVRPAPYHLTVTPMANPQAGKIALLGGAVDAIVADWLWAARIRAAGDRVIFLPYSGAVGSLVVHKDSGITTLDDLRGKRVGVAGGPMDKSWLLFKAVLGQAGINEQTDLSVQFAAPPLLSAQLEQGDLDAVLTFWHFAARLNGAGHPSLLTVDAMVDQLQTERNQGRAADTEPNGLQEDRSPPSPLPWLGYVIRQDWAEAHPEALRAFYNDALRSRRLLHSDRQLWQHMAGLTNDSPAVQSFMRAAWEQGLPQPWGPQERARCAALFQILRDLGGERLVGEATVLDPALFYPLTLTEAGQAHWAAPADQAH